MAVVQLWQRLVCSGGGGSGASSTAASARAQSLARRPEVLGKLEGVARLLSLKLAADQKYLTKLEQQKGSDTSARQATRALLATGRQLRALRGVLGATGACGSAEGAAAVAADGGGEGGPALGKNTLVRQVLRGEM